MRELLTKSLLLVGIAGLLLAGCATPVESLQSSAIKGDIASVGRNLTSAGNADVRRKAALLLANFPASDALPFLQVGANDGNSRVRTQVARTLGGYESNIVVPLLRNMVNDPSDRVKSYAISGLGGKIGQDDAQTINMVRSLLSSDSNLLRLAGAEFFAKMGLEDGHKETIAVLDAQYFSDVRRAIVTLKYFKDERDISYLQKFLVAKDNVSRQLAVESIEYITGGKLSQSEIDALRSDAQNLSMALATGQATTLGKRPSIYVAYPRSNTQVAENMVDVIAYVKSDNRAQKMEVRVNNELVPIDTLWADYDVQYQGLRGFPLRWRVPLSKIGINHIDINVTDRQGFLVSQRIEVVRIELGEEKTPTTTVGETATLLAARLENISKGESDTEVTPENFMAILGDWVKDTSYSDYNKGNSMLDQGRYQRAAYYFNRAIKTNEFGEAYYNLGLSQHAQGLQADASAAFQKACGLDITQACELSG